jgi:CRP-like cAMP-binding protein
VLQQGDPADSFHLVLSGKARVVGKPRARILRTGDYFGEMALIDGAPRSATIAADEELRTMRIPRKPFMRLVAREPSIAMALLAELAGRVRRLEKERRLTHREVCGAPSAVSKTRMRRTPRDARAPGSACL